MPVFEVQVKKTQRADHPNSVDFPKNPDAFVLVHNHNWNDFGYYLNFALWYFPEGRKVFIGELKLMNFHEDDVFDIICDGFSEPLGNDFCSLGVDSSFYWNLKSCLGNSNGVENGEGNNLIHEVLHYLSDCSIDRTVYDKFINRRDFKSTILRDYSAENALREAPLIISGLNHDQAYSFDYSCKIPGCGDIPAEWHVEFSYDALQFRRCVGIIGENGVGKTYMLGQFVKDFLKRESESFIHKPIYGGILVACSNYRDRYPAEDMIRDIEDLNIHSKFYNLHKPLDENRDVDKIAKEISSIASKYNVQNRSVLEWFKETIVKTITTDLDEIFINEPTNIGTEEKPYYVDTLKVFPEDQLKVKLKVLSSGQFYSLALVTFLFANIHTGSLIILDEPETHLHPSVIVGLMRALYNILDIYKSYAIIATHSPLIIREMPRENVYRFSRVEEVIPTIDRVAFDTFGEDISTLYSRIFGYDEHNSVFSDNVRNYLDHHRINDSTIERIIDWLSEGKGLNINARMRIDEIISEEVESR